MKRIIDLLRLSAKILLALVVLVMASGFFTAKPSLLGGSFATYRWLHTRLVPVVFMPVLLLHTTTGLLFLLSRSKRWNTPWARRGVVGGWLLVGALLTTLYFVNPRPASVVPLAEDPPSGLPAAEDAGPPGDAAPTSDPPSAATGSDPSAPSGSARQPTATASIADSRSGIAPPTPSSAPPAPSSTRPPVPTAAPSAPALDSNKVVQAKCAGCHGLDQVYAEKRSTAEWNEVIDRMIGLGAELTAAERAAVMRVMPRR